MLAVTDPPQLRLGDQQHPSRGVDVAAPGRGVELGFGVAVYNMASAAKRTIKTTPPNKATSMENRQPSGLEPL